MTKKAEKLLEGMKKSKNNWKRRDLDSLYQGYGFVIWPGKSHDIVKHPIFPDIRTTLPRHNDLAKGYIEEAIKKISKLQERLGKKEGNNE